MEEKKGKKKNLQSQGVDSNPQPSEGKAPVCKATLTLHKDSWLQLLYEYHQVNSIAQYSMHKERERKCQELNLKVQLTVQAEYEQL